MNEVKAMRQSLEQLANLLKFENVGGGGTPAVQVVLPPIDSDMLNTILQTLALTGMSQNPNYRLTIAVLAGETVIFPFNLPGGYYCTKRTPIMFYADYYDTNITINVWVDEGYNVTPFGMSVYPGGVITVNFGEFWLKKRLVTIKIDNKSIRDTNITFEVNPSLVSENLYRDWYSPIIEFTKSRLNDAAVLMGGTAI